MGGGYDPHIRTRDLGYGHPVDLRSPAERAAACKGDPAKAYHLHLNDHLISLERLRGRHYAAVWAQFEAAARTIQLDSGGTLWERLEGSLVDLNG